MSLTRYLIKFCYELENSSRYNSSKYFFYDLIKNPQSKIRPYFDIVMILLVIASVYLIIYEVKHDLGMFGDVFEWCAVSVFLFEYLMRFWLHSSIHKTIIEHYEKAEFIGKPFSLWLSFKDVFSIKWAYVTKPMAIIDLLAIIPSYRPLRFLRIFLLFRLFKLFRYVNSYNEFIRVLADKRFEFYTIFIFITFIIFTAASAIFFFESKADGGQVKSFFDALYWAVITLTAVGYGDITPQTTEGRVITMVLVFCGITVIAFITSVIVSAFNEKIVEMRENRVFTLLEKRKGKHIILCGYGRMGSVVAKHLIKEHKQIVVIESNQNNISNAKKAGLLVIEGHAENNELLKSAGIANQAEMILCLTGSDVINVYITLTARYLNPDIVIISRANREDAIRKLKQVGANHTVVPFKIAGLIAVEFIGQPVAFEAIYDILSGKNHIGLETITVRESSVVDGKNISLINFWENKVQLFGVITKTDRDIVQEKQPLPIKLNYFYFNPSATFKLAVGDIILLIGHKYSIAHLKNQLNIMQI